MHRNAAKTCLTTLIRLVTRHFGAASVQFSDRQGPTEAKTQTYSKISGKSPLPPLSRESIAPPRSFQNQQSTVNFQQVVIHTLPTVCVQVFRSLLSCSFHGVRNSAHCIHMTMQGLCVCSSNRTLAGLRVRPHLVCTAATFSCSFPCKASTCSSRLLSPADAEH